MMPAPRSTSPSGPRRSATSTSAFSTARATSASSSFAGSSAMPATVAAPPTTNKILVLATISCAYPGADTVGQAHIDYPDNVFVMRVPAPVLFPADFYIRSFEKGVGGIIIMACGTDCPYEGAYKRLA